MLSARTAQALGQMNAAPPLGGGQRATPRPNQLSLTKSQGLSAPGRSPLPPGHTWGATRKRAASPPSRINANHGSDSVTWTLEQANSAVELLGAGLELVAPCPALLCHAPPPPFILCPGSSFHQGWGTGLLGTASGLLCPLASSGVCGMGGTGRRSRVGGGRH